MILAMPLALAACKQGSQVLEILGFSMGTTYKVVAVDHANSLDKAQLEGAISAALADVNGSMSNWDSSSEISKFNAQTGTSAIPMSSDLAVVMSAAADVNAASGGRFDTTVGPLVELWGFGANGTQQIPSDAEIETARAKSGHANTLRVGNGTLQKTQAGAQVYLSAIGKGFGADKVGQALETLGVSDYLVEIGGDLYASGKNPDGLPWQIGVEAPNAANRSVLGVVGLSGLGMASSGDYRNFFEEDGTRYSHLIDPATGRPIEHKTVSATVLAKNAMLADAWATAMLILGREEGLEVAKANGLAVQFIEHDAEAGGLQFKTHASEAFKTLTA
jgi:thiamine biosynthesis lipoprotein